MNEKEFLFWLEGFLEGKKNLSEEDLLLLKEKRKGVVPVLRIEPVVVPFVQPHIRPWWENEYEITCTPWSSGTKLFLSQPRTWCYGT